MKPRIPAHQHQRLGAVEGPAPHVGEDVEDRLRRGASLLQHELVWLAAIILFDVDVVRALPEFPVEPAPVRGLLRVRQTAEFPLLFDDARCGLQAAHVALLRATRYHRGRSSDDERTEEGWTKRRGAEDLVDRAMDDVALRTRRSIVADPARGAAGHDSEGSGGGVTCQPPWRRPFGSLTPSL